MVSEVLKKNILINPVNDIFEISNEFQLRIKS